MPPFPSLTAYLRQISRHITVSEHYSHMNVRIMFSFQHLSVAMEFFCRPVICYTKPYA